MMYKWDEMG